MSVSVPISDSTRRRVLSAAESAGKPFTKAPSVTEGGKPFFWVRFSPDPKGGRCRERIMWDRSKRAWVRSWQVAGEW